VEEQIQIVQDAIRAIRDIRSKYNRPADELSKVSAQGSLKTVNILNENAQLIKQLAGVKDFQAGAETAKPRNAATAIVADLRIYVHDAIDPDAERERLEKQKQQLEAAKKTVEAKLSNKDFVSKAKPEVVAQAREKLAQLQEQLETVRKHLFELDG
jgi:valyl-tRNA synthetase